MHIRCARCPGHPQVYDALENYPRATRWYTAALRLDPFNYEVRGSCEG